MSDATIEQVRYRRLDGWVGVQDVTGGGGRVRTVLGFFLRSSGKQASDPLMVSYDSWLRITRFCGYRHNPGH